MDPHITTICAVLSVFLSTVAFIPYVVETWKVKGGSEVKPTISGFTCWMLSDAAILTALCPPCIKRWPLQRWGGFCFEKFFMH